MRSRKPKRKQHILSIAFASRRLGFVVMYGGNLIDYGVKDIPGTDKQLALSKVQKMIDRYRPDYICIQDIEDPECKLGKSVRAVLGELKVKFTKQKIPFKVVSKSDVRDGLGLSNDDDKQKIAVSVVDIYPELQKLLPQPRKVWEGENRNMPTLVAVGLLVTTNTK